MIADFEGRKVEFPDGTTTEEMQQALQTLPDPTPQPEQEAWYSRWGRSVVDMIKETPESAGSYFTANGALIGKAVSESVAGLYSKVNNVADYFANGYLLKDEIAKTILDKPQIETYISSKQAVPFSKYIDNVVDTWRGNAAVFEAIAKKHGYNAVDELIASTVGGAPLGAAEFMMNIPFATVTGAADAWEAGDSVAVGAIKGALKRYMVGRVFESANLLNKPLAMGASGAAMAADTVASGGSMTDAAKAFGSGLLISAPNRGGNIGFRDLFRKERPPFFKPTDSEVNNNTVADTAFDKVSDADVARIISDLYKPYAIATEGRQAFLRYMGQTTHEFLDMKFSGTGKVGSERKMRENYEVKDPDINIVQDRLYGYNTTDMPEGSRHRLNPEVGIGKEPYLIEAHKTLTVGSNLWKGIEAKAKEKLVKDAFYEPTDSEAIRQASYKIAAREGYEAINLGKEGAIFLQTGTAVKHIPTLIKSVLEAHEEFGGSTFNLITGKNMVGEEAFSVSIYPDKTKAVEGKTVPDSVLQEYVIKNADVLGLSTHCLGTWYENPALEFPKGRTWLDVVVPIVNKADAIKLGKAFNQKAIYDLKTLEEIPTGGTGEPSKRYKVDKGKLLINPEMEAVSEVTESKTAYNAASDESTNSSSKKVKQDTKQEMVINRRSVRLTEEELSDIADKIIKAETKNNSEYRSEVFKNLDTIGDVQRLMDILEANERVRDTFGTHKTETLGMTEEKATSWAEKICNEMGFSLKELRGIKGTMEEMIPKIVAWRRLGKEHSIYLTELREKLKSPDATFVDMYNFLGQIAWGTELVGLLKGTQESASRLLGSYRIHNDGKLINFKDITKDMLDGSPELNAKFEDIRKKFNQKDFDELLGNYDKAVKENNGTLGTPVKIMPSIKGSKFWNFMLEMSNINLLSSPATHFANFTGNVIKPAFDVTRTYAQVGIGEVFQRNKSDRVMLGEANARTVAMLASTWDAFIKRPVVSIKNTVTGLPEYIKSKSFAEIIQDIIASPEKMEQHIQNTGIDPYYTKGQEASGGNRVISSAYLQDSSVGKTFDALLMNGTVQDVFWKMVDVAGAVGRNVSYGILSAVDKPFKEIHYNGELAAQIYKASLKQDFANKAEAKEWIDRTTQNTIKFRDNVEFKATDAEFKLIKDINAEAMQNARVGTWQNELGDMGKWAERGLNKSPFLRFAAVRFFKTPVNLLKEAHTFSPLPTIEAGASKLLGLGWKVEKDMSGSNGADVQSKACATQLMGWLLFAGAWALVDGGYITGAHPKEKKDALLSAGIPEYSIKIDDTYVQYNRVDPYMMPFSIIADVRNAYQYLDANRQEELPAMLALALSNSIFHKTWAQQMGNMFEFMSDPVKNKRTFVNSIISPVLPAVGIARYVNGVNDPVMREAETVVELVTRTYKSDVNRAKLDWLGNPVENTKTAAGITVSEFNKSPIYKEAARLGMHVNDLPDSISLIKGNVKLTPEEHWKINESLSSKFHMEDRLNSYVTSERYATMNDARREDALKMLISTIHRAAIQQGIATDTNVKDAIIKDNRQQFKILTGEPTSIGKFDLKKAVAPKYNKHLTR